ncbi:hypothetical protein GCM10009530_49250 [Microbispora corallina]|uniref:Uncharacterized protein n=1 Tax=Microbispora corallina TaxID=83302 RepID=A0ABQ4FQN1_9ACTN|nr:hypothetical protein Mco01_01240 [Microbispora corallina]
MNWWSVLIRPSSPSVRKSKPTESTSPEAVLTISQWKRNAAVPAAGMAAFHPGAGHGHDAAASTVGAVPRLADRAYEVTALVQEAYRSA